MQDTAACKYASKLLKTGCASYAQRACSACFVPVLQKMQINRDFPLSRDFVAARRDLLTAVAHPLALAARPLQDERPELKQYHNPSLSGICAVVMRLCTSLPACGGAMQNTIKKSRSSKLDAIFIVFCGE